ncbi:MAG: arylamine N-acetyltransferase [Tibeticola sp.]
MMARRLATLEARLGVDPFRVANADSLAQWVIAYQRCIAFENLDVLAGEPVSTDIESIAEKIVDRARGGWCFEVNLLLGELLHRQGFTVTPQLARVTYRRPNPGPLSHLVLRVNADSQDWLVDAGFGGPGPLAPLALIPGETQDGWGCRWQLDPSGLDGMQLSRWIEGQWEPIYTLVPLAVLPADIEVASFFLSQWPLSPFRRKLISMAFDGQWLWCIEERSLVQRDAHWTEMVRTPIHDADHLKALLEKRFGITASAELCLKAWSHLISA